MGAKLILRSLAVAVPAMVVNVACAFLWVFIYSMLIAPGQDEAAYQAYAMRAAPWCSVIAGMPILFGAGWLLARWHGGGWRTGIYAGAAYVAIDFAIVLAAGALPAMAGIIALSFATKLGASALGGALAGKS
ncbi:MAG TPA: hypothetical protein VEW71_09680 [Allosphingosinicella sp.]|nr:hypothetical protein [Allosphingosinicella sp.]